MIDFVVLLLVLLTFLLIWQFAGYPLLMGIIALSPQNNQHTICDSIPFVSIIVPTFNEGKGISQRIRNLQELDYPKNRYEIIIVDSGSTDDTQQITKSFIVQDKIPKLILVTEEQRRGKASAINFGKKYAQGELILVTDGNSFFDKQVLNKIVPFFDDQRIGAVGGRFVPSNPNDNSLSSSTQFYWDLEYIMRVGEAKLSSACLFHGEINAWRKNLVEADTDIVSEDLDMVLQIIRKGLKVAYAGDAIVWEPVPTTIEDQIRQRKRNTIGTIKCIRKHIRFLAVPRDWYRILIFPSHKLLAVLSPFILLAIPVLYLISWNLSLVAMHAIASFLLFLVFSVGLILVRSKMIPQEKDVSRIAPGRIVGIAWFVLLNEYLVLLAWKDYIFHQYSVLWEKVESTRG